MNNTTELRVKVEIETEKLCRDIDKVIYLLSESLENPYSFFILREVLLNFKKEILNGKIKEEKNC